MSFTLQIRKTGGGLLQEVKKFAIYRQIILADDEKVIDKITPHLQLITKKSELIVKQRNDNFVLYQICYSNEFENQVCQDLPSNLIFYFIPPPVSHLHIKDYKNVEYSLSNNFSKKITQNRFHNYFSFKKISDTTFNFFLLSEDGTKHFEKTLIPFSINPPANDLKIVEHNIDTYTLKTGFYSVDGTTYFHSKEPITETNHYFFNINI